jgi:hypothetical protein
VAGPAITATDTGFLIAYRNGNVDNSVANLALSPLSDEGALGPESSQPIETCANVSVDDGIGLVVSSSSVAIASRPYCPDPVDPSLDKPADLVAFTFNKDTAVLDPALPIHVSTGPGLLAELTLARSNSLVFSSGAFQAVFVSQGVAYRAQVVSDQANPVKLFETGGSSYAQHSATSDVLATLATRDAETRLLINTNLTVHQALSPMGSLATWVQGATTRIGAVTVDPYGALTWSAMDSQGASLGAGTIPVSGVTSTNVVALRDHALIAIGRPSGLDLHKLKGALGAKLAVDGSGVVQQDTVGTESLAAFDGARVAIAAARNRVAVVWLTKHALGAMEPKGGFAVYACEE